MCACIQLNERGCAGKCLHMLKLILKKKKEKTCNSETTLYSETTLKLLCYANVITLRRHKNSNVQYMKLILFELIFIISTYTS